MVVKGGFDVFRILEAAHSVATSLPKDIFLR
jgi:hypothetical protein